MADAAFEKVTRSDKLLYGPPKLLLCGFPADAHPKLKAVMGMAGLSEVPVVWVTEDQLETRIADLLELPHGSGAGVSSDLPRAVIVSGIREGRLHGFMAVSRKTGMKQALWAVVTPRSETWTLRALLAELDAEREVMHAKPR